MSPEPGTAALPAAGSLTEEQARGEFGRVMTDRTHPHYGDPNGAYMTEIYRRIPGASAPVTFGEGISVVGRPAAAPADPAAPNLGEPNPGAQVGAELAAISPEDQAADERAFEALRYELGTVEGDATIEAARQTAQAMVNEHGAEAVNELLNDYFEAGGSREAGIKFLARYGKQLGLY